MADNAISLAALGGLLSQAMKAYQACEGGADEKTPHLDWDKLQVKLQEVKAEGTKEEQAQVEVVKQKQEQDEAATSLLQKVEALKRSFETELAALKRRRLLAMSLADVEGTWWDVRSNSRVTVDAGGNCMYDSGAVKRIEAADGTLVLKDGVRREQLKTELVDLSDDHYSLSQDESCRQQLVWQGDGEARLTWTYERPSGSRQLVMALSVEHLLKGHRQFDKALNEEVQLRSYDYPFSLVGCDVGLTLSRSSKDMEGNFVNGSDFIGVHFGLLPPTVRHAAASATVQSVSGTVLIEVWDPKRKAWRLLLRNYRRRYEANGRRYGEFDSMPFAQFAGLAEREVAPVTPKPKADPSLKREGKKHRMCTFRATITDIGLLELKRDTSQPLLPSNLQS